MYGTVVSANDTRSIEQYVKMSTFKNDSISVGATRSNNSYHSTLKMINAPSRMLVFAMPN